MNFNTWVKFCMYHSFFDFRDLSLNINEFTALLRALFRNEKGRPYPIDETMCTEIFNIFNKSGVRAHVDSQLQWPPGR